ncbi:hypothetical protein [Sulfitobacter sp. PS-8MA]|uniref:hypothetical protein n=1 Tax=Sulfitobacter sp. PS-8MA TaxID=3237707 RepID=UPI0034C5DBEA
MAQIRAALVLDIVVNDTCNTAEDEHPMMNSNKILTVSYGTFSCTLEGFDDSFGTMKAIAEYFRDLASDDRYFGAEPPQPDAEMLARIAQREVSRRVQAREQEGKIVLSALEDQSAAASGVAAPQVAQAAPAPQTTAAPQAAATSQAAPAPQPVAPQPVAAEAEPADTAALDAEIADTAAVAAAQPVEAPASPKAEAPVADAPAAEAHAVETPEDEAVAAEATEAEAFFASSPQPQTDYEDEAPTATAEDVTTAPAPPADSIAAKLQRIRAVVAQQDEAEGYDDEDAANAAAPEMTASPSETAQNDTAITAARREIEEALEADEAADASAEQDAAAAEDDDLAEALNRFEQGDAAAADAAPEPARDESEKPAPRGRVIRVRRAKLDAAVSRGDLEEVTEPKAETAQNDSEATAKAKASGSSLSPEEEDDLARELAALEAELAGATAAEQEAEAPTPEIEDTLAVEAEVDEAPLSEEALETVAAEEPETEEPHREALETPAAAETPAESEAAQAARRSLPTIDDETSPDMSRLMAETDSKMGEPESATRRDAFAHLRAAVAAKKADEAMGGRATTATADDAYREDLAEVVRPRRPVSRPARTERPSGDARPAPLKLVAEQRIDVEQMRPTGPVRPRRVAAVVEPSKANPDAESFADFAADMGATKLPELLEAAASYMSFVEGRDQFSRPQLMGKVRSVGLNEFSREDGLRSFGQLLRAGKIEKIKGGRFTVSEDIGYRPDHRAVG